MEGPTLQVREYRLKLQALPKKPMGVGLVARSGSYGRTGWGRIARVDRHPTVGVSAIVLRDWRGRKTPPSIASEKELDKRAAASVYKCI